MIKRLQTNVGDFLSSYPILKSFLRMFIDKRYFYHNLQGNFTNYILREYLKKVELLFYRKRVNLYKNSQYILLDGKEKLIDDGIIENPIKLEAKIADDIKDYLRNKLCHDPEEKNSSYFKISEAKPNIKKAYYMCEDVVQAPHVMEIANNSILLRYVSEYFGALPSIDYIGAWWSLPTDTPSLTQSFHRDIDTLHSMKFFIYLTEVSENTGPHVYIKGSCKSKFNSVKDKMYSDQEIYRFFDREQTLNLLGPKGYCFLADTFGLHKGMPPIESPRLVLQVIFSLKQTPFGPKKPFLDYDKLKNTDLNLPTTTLVNNNIVRKIF